MWNRRGFLSGLAAATVSTRAWAGPRPIVRRDFLVCLDPGHGGDNDGCRSADGSVVEKDLTLRTALALQAAVLAKLPHVQVVLTREDDQSCTLAERVAFANAAEADAFISLHTNASQSKTQHGFETYVLDARASSLEAARTARRENDAELCEPGSTRDGAEVATMLRQLEMTQQRLAAGRFAQSIQAHQRKRFPKRVDRGVRQAPFDVLMGARMPAVLFESGFLDHEEEGSLLTSDTGMDSIVGGLADAVVDLYRAHVQTR
ncbi:MAG: N-acetylmuramoyl-L-alanine amidase [Nannocystaceae bacterium]|nr:N-acetylmuramoyl-L-alanine amidase [bacterium]